MTANGDNRNVETLLGWSDAAERGLATTSRLDRLTNALLLCGGCCVIVVGLLYSLAWPSGVDRLSVLGLLISVALVAAFLIFRDSSIRGANRQLKFALRIGGYSRIATAVEVASPDRFSGSSSLGNHYARHAIKAVGIPQVSFRDVTLRYMIKGVIGTAMIIGSIMVAMSADSRSSHPSVPEIESDLRARSQSQAAKSSLISFSVGWSHRSDERSDEPVLLGPCRVVPSNADIRLSVVFDGDVEGIAVRDESNAVRATHAEVVFDGDEVELRFPAGEPGAFRFVVLWTDRENDTQYAYQMTEPIEVVAARSPSVSLSTELSSVTPNGIVRATIRAADEFGLVQVGALANKGAETLRDNSVDLKADRTGAAPLRVVAEEVVFDLHGSQLSNGDELRIIGNAASLSGMQGSSALIEIRIVAPEAKRAELIAKSKRELDSLLVSIDQWRKLARRILGDGEDPAQFRQSTVRLYRRIRLSDQGAAGRIQQIVSAFDDNRIDAFVPSDRLRMVQEKLTQTSEGPLADLIQRLRENPETPLSAETQLLISDILRRLEIVESLSAEIAQDGVSESTVVDRVEISRRAIESIERILSLQEGLSGRLDGRESEGDRRGLLYEAEEIVTEMTVLLKAANVAELIKVKPEIERAGQLTLAGRDDIQAGQYQSAAEFLIASEELLQSVAGKLQRDVLRMERSIAARRSKAIGDRFSDIFEVQDQIRTSVLAIHAESKAGFNRSLKLRMVENGAAQRKVMRELSAFRKTGGLSELSSAATSLLESTMTTAADYLDALDIEAAVTSQAALQSLISFIKAIVEESGQEIPSIKELAEAPSQAEVDPSIRIASSVLQPLQVLRRRTEDLDDTNRQLRGEIAQSHRLLVELATAVAALEPETSASTDENKYNGPSRELLSLIERLLTKIAEALESDDGLGPVRDSQSELILLLSDRLNVEGAAAEDVGGGSASGSPEVTGPDGSVGSASGGQSGSDGGVSAGAAAGGASGGPVDASTGETDIALQARLRLTYGRWGELPDRQRDQIGTIGGVRPPTRFEAAIERYRQSIAE
ncbi:hypothetical protein [Stratiformator vulcanicus]|uniref:DUF4175 family protein n=1 Tax=Stratiformator vulcanicus TaxID=2527980 RepID=A0A517R0B6_9PLAN|nr:hypothetical protein [Stratiformator vulcanicus]QDT37308.1 hypothetical protein Pan189_16810 [Stratiformator vulcanicus]